MLMPHRTGVSTNRYCLLPALLALSYMSIAPGCARKSPSPSSSRPSPEDLAPGATASDHWATPSEDECREFAGTLERLVAEGDRRAINRCIDWDQLLGRTTNNAGAAQRTITEFTSGAKSALGGEGAFAGVISRQVSQGASYTFLHTAQRDGRPCVRFRLLNLQSGVNYHDYILTKDPHNEIKAIDIYVFAAGEFLSQTMRQPFLQLVAHEDRSIVQKLTKEDADLLKHMETLNSMATAMREQRFTDVLKAYDTLPESVQLMKGTLILRMAAATQVDSAEYMSSLQTLMKHYPNDACADLMSIDYFLLNEQYDKAVDCVARVDKAVEGDPYLHVLVGGIRSLQQQWDTARAAYESAIEEDPDLIDAYHGVLLATAKQQQFDDTVKYLDELSRRFNQELEDLATIPEFAEFIKSPQYEQWKKSRQ